MQAAAWRCRSDQHGGGASTALGLLDTAVNTVMSSRGSRCRSEPAESNVNNLTSTVTNLAEAVAYADADYSAESTSLLVADPHQASTAMLAQANQSQQASSTCCAVDYNSISAPAHRAGAISYDR
jgi:flagellin-like hook-associated protein FlgL